MKFFRSTGFFALVTLVFSLSVYFFVYKKSETEKSNKEKDAVVVRLDEEQISHIELVTKTSKVVLELQGNQAGGAGTASSQAGGAGAANNQAGGAGTTNSQAESRPESRSEKQAEAKSEKPAEAKSEKQAEAKSEKQAEAKSEKQAEAKWMILEPLREVADEPTVKGFITTLKGEKSEEIVEEGAQIKWETYGLDQPVTKLVVKGKDGHEQVLQIGSASYDGKLYARRDQDQQVLLVAQSWDMNLSKNVNEFRNKKAYTDESDTFTQIELVNNKNHKESFTLTKVSGHWKAKGAPETLVLSDETIHHFVQDLRGIFASQLLPALKSDAKETAHYGLDRPTYLLKVLREGKDPFEMRLAVTNPKPQEKPKSLLPDQIPPKAQPEVVGLSTDLPALARFSFESIQPVLKKTDDFFDRKAPFKFPVENIKQIAVRTSSDETLLQKKTDRWELVNTAVHAKKEADQAKITELLASLVGFEAHHFLTDARPRKDLDKSEIKLFNDKGVEVFRLNWSRDPVKAKEGDKELFYFVKSNLTEVEMAVEANLINKLPLLSLLKEKAVTPDLKDLTKPSGASSARPATKP